MEDENDHAPKIIVPTHDIEVLENREPGVVYTVLAFDMDTGNNGAIKYYIIGKYFLYWNSPHDTDWVDTLCGDYSLFRVCRSVGKAHTQLELTGALGFLSASFLQPSRTTALNN